MKRYFFLTAFLIFAANSSDAADYSLPNDGGWYQLQQIVAPWGTVCQTGDAMPCDVPAGSYVLRNHANDSSAPVTVSAANSATAPVVGATLSRHLNECELTEPGSGTFSASCSANCPVGKKMTGVTSCYATGGGRIFPSGVVRTSDEAAYCLASGVSPILITVEVACQ